MSGPGLGRSLVRSVAPPVGAKINLQRVLGKASLQVAPDGVPNYCVHLFCHVFLRFLAHLLEQDMRTVWLICHVMGELFLVDAETTGRVLGVEFDYHIEANCQQWFLRKWGLACVW